MYYNNRKDRGSYISSSKSVTIRKGSMYPFDNKDAAESFLDRSIDGILVNKFGSWCVVHKDSI